MRTVKLTKQERVVEDALLNGEYRSVGKDEFHQIASAIASRKKDAVLNIRINSQDLKSLKQKAQKLGIKYQTFISELLHKMAEA